MVLTLHEDLPHHDIGNSVFVMELYNSGLLPLDHTIG